MKKILTKNFFNRSAPEVAEDLLGKYLVRNYDGKEVALKITEVEAYEGLEDLASHAARGVTPRNKIMFGEAGKLYIYFVYGMHHMLNVVTGKEGYPAAVLIRGTENIIGPGRLTRQLGITKALNTMPALPETGLWFEDRGEKVSKESIKKTPRIGVNYAGEIWSQKLYRFIL